MHPAPRLPIVVFDGECGLCNGFVAWLVRHDPGGRLLIAGSAGEAGRAAVRAAGLPDEITASTLVVWDGQAWVKSEAVFAVARHLGWPWRALRAARVVPRSWRDRVYDVIARRRPRIVADDPACGVPPRDLVTAWRVRLATVGDIERESA